MRKLFLIPVIIIGFLIFVFLLAGTPFFLTFVKKKIEATIEETTGMSLVIGRLRGNLFYSVQLEGVDFGKTIRIENLRVSYNPFRLAAKQLDITSVKVSGLHVDFDRLEELLKNLPKRTEKKEAEPSAFVISIGEFSVKNSGFFKTLGSTSVEVSVVTRGSLMRDQLTLDSLYLRTDKSRIMISGSIPMNERNDLALRYDIGVAAEELGVSGLSGEIRGQGSVRGKVSAIELQLATQLAIRYFENDLNGVVQVGWLLPDFRHLRVDARLNAWTKSLRKEIYERDSTSVIVRLEDTHLDCDVRSNLGNLRVCGNLKDDFTKPYFKGTVEGSFDYADFEPSFTGRVYYRNDTLELSDLALISRRVALDLYLLFNTKTQEISSANVDLSCNDLSVWNTFISAPANVAGKLWCSLNMSGSFDNLQATAKLRITDAEIYSEESTEIDLDLSLRGSVAALDSGRISNKRGEIMLAGSYNIKERDFIASLYSDGVVFTAPEVFGSATLPLGGTVALDLRAHGNVHEPECMGEIFVSDFVYDTLCFGDYRIEFLLQDDTLRYSLVNEEENLVLRATTVLYGIFPFTANLELQHFVLDQYITPATGHVTAQISAEGTFAQLENTTGTVQIDTMKLFVEQKPIENIEAIIADLEGGEIHVQSCELTVAGQNLNLQGSMPLDFESAAMDLSASSSEIQLSDIAYLLPKDPAISGVLKFSLHVGGRPEALDIDGQLTLANGRYDFNNVRIDSVNSYFKFKNGVITSERFSGKMNKGRFAIEGFADLSRGLLDTVSLVIEVDRVDYANKEFGRVVSSADLQVSVKRDSMWVSGEVVINEAVYDKAMRLQTIIGLLTKANRPAPQQPEISRRIYCNVGITVPDSVKIANNVANLAVKADLQLKGYLAHLNVYGTIAALNEGTIQYLGKKFKIVNAVIQFDDPYKIDPVIDLTATSTIAAADDDYEIYLLLDGTATTWHLELNSNPPLPEQDIVSLLLIGQRRPGAVGGMAKELDLKGKVKDYALDMVRHNIEKTTEEFLGLDEFTLTGDLSDPTKMRIGIEKSIAAGFRLHYSTGVESWELYQVGASYDLTDRISISTLYDQENRNTSVDLEYHLKIK